MKHERTFFGLFIALILLSALFFVIERIVGRYSGRQQPVIRKGWFTDVIYWFVTPLITKPLTAISFLLPAAVLVICGLATREGLQTHEYTGFGPVGRQPVWLQGLEIYVLFDLMGYWSHRLFHFGPWWPFHAVHHSSEELDWLGAVRVHPVNDLVSKAIQVTPLLLLGFNPFVTLSAAPFFTLYAIFLHANVNWDFGPLRSIIATPVFHRWHHSKDREAWDKNFAGLFPFWDILFGTYYMPKGRYPENFGICEPMPAGFLGQLWEPFAWLRRRARKVNPEEDVPRAEARA